MHNLGWTVEMLSMQIHGDLLYKKNLQNIKDVISNVIFFGWLEIIIWKLLSLGLKEVPIGDLVGFFLH